MAKFELPKELSDKVLRLVEEVRASGKIRKGTNEVTKSVERSEAKFVIIASDVNPPEIVMHIPMLCEEKKIPYAWVPAKSDLGAASGLPVGTSAIAVADAGEANKKLSGVLEEIREIVSPKPKKEAHKEAPKAEEKKEAPKEEKPKKDAKPKKPKAEAKPEQGPSAEG